MMMKTIQASVDVLVAFSVWCAAIVFAVFVAIMVRHLVAGGMTAYHLLHS